MLNIFFIGLGGAIGSIARYLLDLVITQYFRFENFPIGIFVVNVLGCFLIGFFSHFFNSNTLISNEFKAFVTVGVLGGFTTYSTFKNDAFLLLSKGNFFEAIFYMSATLIVGMIAVYAGYLLSGFIID